MSEFLLEVSSLLAINYGFDRDFSMLMTYFKSVLTGLAAVLVIFGILPMLMTFFYFLVIVPMHGEHESEASFYLVHWRVPTVAGWLFALSVFAIGFVWEFRRLRKRDVPSLPSSTNFPTS